MDKKINFAYILFDCSEYVLFCFMEIVKAKLFIYFATVAEKKIFKKMVFPHAEK